jgi:hypothetical protein
MSRAGSRKSFAGKSLFVALMAAACLLITGVLVFLWWVQGAGLSALHPLLPVITSYFLGFLILVMVAGTSLLLVTTLLGRDILLTRLLRGLAIRLLLPLIEFIGRMAGIHRDRIRQSFISMNNSLVVSQLSRVKADRVLILLPHCLQLADCDIKVTGDIGKCARCNRCDISSLAGLAEKYRIHISVVTGGTLARKVIMEKRPKLIVAVACEGDLTSGIRDCYPLPVLGILNERPFGPCFNTSVDTAKIDEALRAIVG